MVFFKQQNPIRNPPLKVKNPYKPKINPKSKNHKKLNNF